MPHAMLDFKCLPLYEWLDLPLWVFDAERLRMAWANPAGRTFWRSPSDKELLSRDFSDVSEGARARLNLSMQAHARGETTRDSWTLYPKGTPVTSVLLARGIVLPGGRQAILFASEPLAASFDADTLRGVEAVQHTTVRIALHGLPDGTALMRNPAAAQAFGPLLAPSAKHRRDFEDF